MSNYKSKIFVTWCLCFLTVLAWSQTNTSDNNTPKINSPYSRIGLGDLVNPNFTAALGMGGLGATYHDPSHANLLNPATLPYLRATAFETALYGQYSSLKNNTTNSSAVDIWSGNINYLSLSFPMRNPVNEELDRKNPDTHWGMNIALLPFSRVGYNAEGESIIEEETTSATTTYNGRGGTYKIQWGNGVKYKNFSAGLNLGYIFGKIINERDVILTDTLIGYNNELLDEISISGVYWNAGLHYKHHFKKTNNKGELVPNGKSVSIGVYGNSNHNITSNTTRLYRRISEGIIDIDTLSQLTEQKDDMTLPATFGVGVLYENLNKWRVGLDYATSQWSNYESVAKPDDLRNAYRIAVGGEYIPDINSYNSYRKKMRYRLGAYYETDPRYLNEQLTNYGITIGLGFPVILPRQTQSFFDVAFEIGQFGTDAAFKDTYIRATFGFTLNDNSWFFKRKFQ